MQNLAEFTEKQPDYRYFKVNDERADIFIYEFVEEKEVPQMETIHPEEVEDDVVSEGDIALLSDDELYDKFVDVVVDKTNDNEEEVVTPTEEKHYTYIYKVNTFTVNPFEITEEMIKENPLDYIDYVKPTEEVEQDEYLLDLDYRITCLELGL